MPELSAADHDARPPRIRMPSRYNAAHDLIERNLRAGRGAKLAYIDDAGRYTYDELAERVQRCAQALRGLGLGRGERMLLCLQDTIDFPTAFLGCIAAGIVPIAISTMLKGADYDFLVRDSGARALIVSAPLLAAFEALPTSRPLIEHLIVSGGDTACGHPSFAALLASGTPGFEPVAVAPDEPCFWLYSSGSTGTPKGTLHAHGSLIRTAELYARPVLGLTADDVVFSAAKLFFAYGLGNALTFPLAVGATSVLMAERATPQAIYARLLRWQPTVFYAVPTLYAALLAAPQLPARAALRLRACVSAGEALPRELGARWLRHFGVDILDGIGSTEMLHIFLSNRPGDVEYGATGVVVPGYEVRLVDEAQQPVADGELGELEVAGPTRALGYWNNPQRGAQTFRGRWTRTGDKYYRNPSGHYVHAGRVDDLLKVGGLYVSPTEVEAALISHPAVLEAAVVAGRDAGGLVKPLAFVVLRDGDAGTPGLVEELKQHVKSRLAPYKYPRWIEFLPELPKTATGKIQRFRLRELATRVTG